MPPRDGESGGSGFSGVVGGVLGVVLVGGGAVGLLVVGCVVGWVTGGSAGPVDGVLVTPGMVGSKRSTICVVGRPGAGVEYGVLSPGTRAVVAPIPGVVAVGNGVGGVVPGEVGVAVVPRGIAGTFWLG